MPNCLLCCALVVTRRALLRTVTLLAFVIAVTTLAPAANAQASTVSAHVDVPTIDPRPDDVGSLDGIVAAYYDVISGPAGQARQWSRDRTLYIPDIRFVSMSMGKDGKPVARTMTHQQFVDASDKSLQGGFYEKEVHRETQRFGNIAHIFSTYESRTKSDGPVIARGINSIQAYWDGKRWWITNAIWDEERPDNPIPAEYSPKPADHPASK
jgi:hypothetical protein